MYDVVHIEDRINPIKICTYTVFFSLASAEALWEKGWSEKGAKIHANKVDWIRAVLRMYTL